MIKDRVAPAKTLLDWKDFADDRLFTTLQKLHQLNIYAAQHRIELDQLAVPISDFRTWGHSDTELRLLVIEGVVRHLKETRAGNAGQRKFEQAVTFSICDSSCFVLAKDLQTLSKQGGELVPVLLPVHPPTDLPNWDLKLRRLVFQGELVKHFKCPARNQEMILSAFQEEGWPKRISDPIPPSKETDSKQRLHDAIRGLNRNQAHALIKFHGDGTGEGVMWSPEEPLPKLTTKRR